MDNIPEVPLSLKDPVIKEVVVQKVNEEAINFDHRLSDELDREIGLDKYL